MALKLNASILLFQSKLLQPNIVGDARWELYSPFNNKGSLALGKDEFPNVLTIIEKIQSNPNYISTLKESDKDTLKEAEIIIEDKRNFLSHNFREFYKIATYNYPFRDYSRSDWFSRDVATMNEFATYGDIPSIFSDRSNLPKIVSSNLKEYNFDFKGSFDLSTLMNLLYDVLAPVTLVKSKTSNPSSQTLVPSGGGKHPIEIHVINWEDNSNLKAGIYVYDIKDKCLRKEKSISQISTEKNGTEIVTLILSINPRRPMWRYRDIRSFRAVFIDIGHVIEIISELLKDVDISLSARVLSGIMETQKKYNWINEPSLAEIAVFNTKNTNILPERHISNKYTTDCNEETTFKTNPFSYISFEDGLTLNTIFPESRKAKISKNQFMILNHSIPSRRRDRKTDYKFLQGMANEDEIDDLIDNYGLIPSGEAVTLYQNVSSWTSHGWYLNLLELAAVFASKEERKGLIDNQNPVRLSNLNKLALRRTEREFDHSNLNWDTINKILDPNYYTNFLKDFNIFVNYKNRESEHCGLYELLSEKLNKVQEYIETNDIRRLVVNQQYAGKSSLDIIITSSSKNFSLEEKLVTFGIIGQRIISVANDVGIQAFMTPAINDEFAQNLLKLNPSTIYYYIELG